MKRQHDYDYEMHHTTSSGKSVLTGLLIGAAIGAATALLMAPRSGEETRAEIRNKAMEYRDRTRDVVNEAKTKAQDLKEGMVEKAEDLRNRGKETVNQQLDQVSQAAEAGKRRVNEY